MVVSVLVSGGSTTTRRTTATKRQSSAGSGNSGATRRTTRTTKETSSANKRAPRCAIYCRISSDRDGEAVGVGRQEKDCRQIAQGRGWEVMAVFVDNDVSAWRRDVHRPGWEQLLDGLKARLFDAVVVYHGDRLMRQPRDLEDLLDTAESAGVQLASPSGQRNLDSADDRFILRIEVAQACKSSDDTSRRVRDTHRHLADTGKPKGGIRGFGYACSNAETCKLGDELCAHDGVSIVKHEAAAIRAAAVAVQRGRPLHAIAADMNAKGIVTATGVSWEGAKVGRLLRQARLAGLREYQGEVVGQAAWKPILDRATWERVMAILDGRGPGRAARPKALLTGILVCGLCGARMVSQPCRGKRTYFCMKDKGGCNRIRIESEGTETEIAGRLFVAVDNHKLGRAVADDARQDDETGEKVAALEAKLNEIAAMYAGDEITKAEWLAARQGVERRLDAAKRQLAKTAAMSPGRDWVGRGAELSDSWDGMDVHTQRAVLDSWIDHVTVAPHFGGRWFNPDRLTVEWRS